MSIFDRSFARFLTMVTLAVIGFSLVTFPGGPATSTLAGTTSPSVNTAPPAGPSGIIRRQPAQECGDVLQQQDQFGTTYVACGARSPCDLGQSCNPRVRVHVAKDGRGTKTTKLVCLCVPGVAKIYEKPVGIDN